MKIIQSSCRNAQARNAQKQRQIPANADAKTPSRVNLFYSAAEE
jgi:hypothetical protein